MNMVVLYFDPGIGRMLREVMELEGHVVLATRDGEEALLAIEECAGPSLLLVDYPLVSPVAREALSRLAVTPMLRQRVRIVGLSAWSGQATVEGLVDTLISLPFTVAMLLETVEANIAHGSAE